MSRVEKRNGIPHEITRQKTRYTSTLKFENPLTTMLVISVLAALSILYSMSSITSVSKEASMPSASTGTLNGNINSGASNQQPATSNTHSGNLTVTTLPVPVPLSPLLCSLEEMTQGSWVNATYLLPPYIPMRGENQQNTCPGFDPKTTAYETYEWMPTSSSSSSNLDPLCEFSRFDPLSYCPLVANKTIAIIGDSISFNHFLSLSHLLGVPQSLPRAMRRGAVLISDTCGNITTRTTPHSDRVILHANGTNLTDILHADELSPKVSKLIGKRDFFLHATPEIIKEYQPDILILNRGAHYTPDSELIHDLNTTIIPALKLWQEECQSRQEPLHTGTGAMVQEYDGTDTPRSLRTNSWTRTRALHGSNQYQNSVRQCMLIWRTSIPGHPNCTDFKRPSNSLSEMEALVQTGAAIKGYNWEKFKDQNAIAVKMLIDAGLDFDVMDAYKVNILRPDGHAGPKDCLHSVSSCMMHYIC